VSIFLCWVVFPLAIWLVALGCGLLVETISGYTLPGPLVPVVGLAVVIVVGDFATMTSATARLATPLAVALSLSGYGLSLPLRGRRLDRWALASGVAVFAVYGAPIVLSGSATFAGYITLDDTATWLALTDHVMDHGRSLAGLAPSTYQQVLTDYLTTGYPLGAFIPLGIGGKLTGQDLAWLFQPTIAVYASALGLAIYAASARLVSRRPLRALVAFLGAQPALLFQYAFWSGIKELAAAAMIALICALVVSTIDRWSTVRGVLPVAIAAAAMLAMLAVAGGVWLVAPAAIAVVALARRGAKPLLAAVIRIAPLTALVSVPSLVLASTFVQVSTGGDVTQSNNSANLGHPLNDLQVLGIWPATDFRVSPHNVALTHVLFGVLALAIAVGLGFAWRRRAWDLPLYLASALGGFVLALVFDHVGLSSPWLDAKAMAEASPAVVAVVVAGAAATFETGRRIEAALVCTALAGGVLWSNGLVYANVWEAPRSQFAELQTIGQRFAGDGPALMTEYQPYGVRHFLRKLDPEGASERRRRLILLRTGGLVPQGASADLDAFQLSSVLVYRSIVLRRSPVESRPPSIYRLVWRGHWYELWQRPQNPRPILEHLSLGEGLDPAAVPSCSDVRRLARLAKRAGGLLATVLRPRAPIVLDLTHGAHPATWAASSDSPGALVANTSGTVSVAASVPASARYSLWLGGSFRRTVTADVDGREVGSVRDQINESGQWTPLGSVTLSAGSHAIALRYGGSRLRPGTGGFPFAMGPLILSATTANLPVTYVPPADAGSLCGKRLDWLEALGS
jgi:hypothetical protein